MLALPGHTSEQRTGNKPKPPLDSKSPIQVRIRLPSAGRPLRTRWRPDRSVSDTRFRTRKDTRYRAGFLLGEPPFGAVAQHARHLRQAFEELLLVQCLRLAAEPASYLDRAVYAAPETALVAPLTPTGDYFWVRQGNRSQNAEIPVPGDYNEP
jgi:hypothetical protein